MEYKFLIITVWQISFVTVASLIADGNQIIVLHVGNDLQPIKYLKHKNFRLIKTN